MVEVAHQALANSYVLKYYKNHVGIHLFEIIENIEKQLIELKKHVDSTWYSKAIDYVDVEEFDFIEVKPKIGAKFTLY